MPDSSGHMLWAAAFGKKAMTELGRFVWWHFGQHDTVMYSSWAAELLANWAEHVRMCEHMLWRNVALYDADGSKLWIKWNGSTEAWSFVTVDAGSDWDLGELEISLHSVTYRGWIRSITVACKMVEEPAEAGIEQVFAIEEFSSCPAA